MKKQFPIGSLGYGLTTRQKRIGNWLALVSVDVNVPLAGGLVAMFSEDVASAPSVKYPGLGDAQAVEEAVRGGRGQMGVDGVGDIGPGAVHVGGGLEQAAGAPIKQDLVAGASN